MMKVLAAHHNITGIFEFKGCKIIGKGQNHILKNFYFYYSDTI
jgi:hypothetical protein